MEEFFKCSILNELFEARNDEFSRKIWRNSKEYQDLLADTESKLKGMLNFVEGAHYEFLEKEIETFLFENVAQLSEFWNLNYYKLGFIDGLKAKKEIKEQMEEFSNGKIIE